MAPPNASALKFRDAPMRLTLSAAVANDLGALREGLKDLAERCGHSACATGCNELHLRLERNFVVNRVRDEVALNPQPLPPIDFPAAKVLHISAPASVLDDIDSLGRTIEKVVGKVGCAPCCSGFDILFQREVDGFAFDAQGELRGTGRFA